ncbi:NAD(P)/FAD-dependent oxidoreductase [uncultured Phenylobacterium sp.]|uniref:flavin-containing monooxygenase n=1 Tax=uncultured Phenylobacterium sp. TaxID=349273 RepID=UPI0025F7A12A|nr:NAD(P)/FAD-dependent oxidoreductase [uncultured Phenylobacterium sp.]
MDNARSGRRIGIIGAGPGGICAGIKLKAAGYDDFVIIEKSAGVGGTWRNARYPGLTCDVRSWSYSFTFEPNAHWSSHYAGQPEILAYMERVAEKYGLGPHLRLGRKVTAAHWDDATSQWRLTAGEGETLTVDILIAAQGMFNDLNWPDAPGLEDFAGVMFHSGDWRDDHDLTGRRVAVIGTAASAVQFLPKIAPKVARLTVFQRSPNWVAPKDDPPITAEERARLTSDPDAVEALRREVHASLESVITFSDRQMLEGATRAALANIDAVQDPALREKMRPTVPWGCLRPLMSNEYYPTYNLPHVELVTEPVERIVAEGVVTRDGRLHAADTLICATGYHVRRYLAAIEVTGRAGLPLATAWADGAEAYLGLMTSGFPNLFMLYGPNTNNGSILYMIERQCDFIVRRLQEMDRDGLAWIDVRRDVMDAYNADLQADLEKVEVWQASCSNYYRTESGRIVTQWPHNMAEYQRRCEADQQGCFETGRAPAPADA